MAGEQRDAAGLHDTAVNDDPNENADTAPAATVDDAPDHTSHDATAATTAMGDEFQWHGTSLIGYFAVYTILQ